MGGVLPTLLVHAWDPFPAHWQRVSEWTSWRKCVQVVGLRKMRCINFRHFYLSSAPFCHFLPQWNDVVDVLAPPVGECYECGSQLVSYHSCNVKLYTLRGVKVVPKITLCCQHCQLFYNYTQFGNKHALGFRYYPQLQPVVEATDTSFVDRRILELQSRLS